MRTCTIDGCERKHVARGYCGPHYNRVVCRGLSPEPVRVRLGESHLEDLAWLDETGESLHGAAARLGVTSDALEQFLRRHGHHDLLYRLLARNPRDWNAFQRKATA